MKIRNVFLASLGLMLAAISLTSAKKAAPDKEKPLTVAFYNMENLFDTQDDPKINDEEFLPTGKNEWTEARYQHKLQQMAKVIDHIGDEDGPEILGMCEVENKQVIEDLVATGSLKKKGYGIVHHDSPDQRGIDCALIYKSKRFMPLYQKAYTVPFVENPDILTRDILLVKGVVDKKVDVTFIVNHWPSRRDGSDESSWKRERAANILRHVVDSILFLDPYANIVMMGDFNDEPGDASVAKMLRAGQDSVEAKSTLLYNCMAPLKAEGRGTLKYKGGWNLFDQIIVSTVMTTPLGSMQYQRESAGIYNPDWMRQTDEGDWKDAPKRTFIGKRFIEDGYSDHFPVFVTLMAK